MTPEELEKRLTSLEDLEKIKIVHRKYLNCLTFTRWDELPTHFTEDGVIQIGIFEPRQGRAEIARLFKEEIGLRHIGREWIFCVNPIINVEGDRATGQWLIYLMFFPELDAAQPKYRQQGIYDCEYAKVNGEWKIKFLKWTPTLAIGPQPARLKDLYAQKGLKM